MHLNLAKEAVVASDVDVDVDVDVAADVDVDVAEDVATNQDATSGSL